MVRARKRFGQHFLEPVWVAKVLAVIAPEPSDCFLEIGPGRGALTLPLVEAAGHVTAFEIDRDLAALLAQDVQTRPHRLTVVEADFLDVTIDSLSAVTKAGDRSLRAAGNLPDNVASPILFKLVALYRQGLPLIDATVMLQREVADRLVAAPGTREYGVLTVLIGRHARAARVLSLPPGAFRPMPRVHSAVVRLTFHAAEPPTGDEAAFEDLTHAIFTRRRKTLANALKAFAPAHVLPPCEALARAGLDGMRRPETLTITELVRLAEAFGTRR